MYKVLNSLSKIKLFRAEYLILVCIALIGAILRLYHLRDLPFMHDELSALIRLNFSTLHELMEKGVKPDGHPAGVQVFLYYWTKLFGYQEWIVKLPFIFFGITSIVLTFMIGRKWHNTTVGLVVAAYIATLQFSIMYSQIARPYSSGLFFCLLTTWYWTKFVEQESTQGDKILLSICCTACCYNHYFSAIFVFCLFGISLLLLKSKIKDIISIFTASFILFIPHLSTSYYQIFVGKGLEWLGKPKFNFTFEYLRYIFHFSWVLLLLAMCIAIFGWITNHKRNITKYQYTSIILFLFPLIFGISYSIWVKPIIQYSMLLFSFPFFLMFLFSGLKEQSIRVMLGLVTWIILSNVYTLTMERQHYFVMQHQPFSRMVELSEELNNSCAKQYKTSIYLGESQDKIEFYKEKLSANFPYTSVYDNGLSKKVFSDKIQKETANDILCGNLPLEFYSMIREKYPFHHFMEGGFTYEYHWFSKTSNIDLLPSDTLYHSSLTFEQEEPEWQFDRSRLLHEENHNTYLNSDSTEWGPKIELSSERYLDSRHAIIDMKLDFKSNDAHCGRLIFEVLKNNKSLEYINYDINEYFDPASKDIWRTAYFSARLSNIIKHNCDLKNTTLRIYYWNIDKQDIDLDNFSITVRQGNKYIYGLSEEI